jgi:AcrR family transcriptional regulator
VLADSLVRICQDRLQAPVEVNKRTLSIEKEVRRDQMLNVASIHFGQNGYANTDVQDIADQLNVGKATIYRQFANKEDLFIACLERGLCNLNGYMLALTKSRDENMSMELKVKAGVLDFLGYFDEHPEVVEILIQARSLFRKRAETAYRKYWEYNSSVWMGRLQTSIDQGRVRKLHAEQLLNVFNDTLFGALITRYFGRPKTELDLTASAIADTLVYGMSTERERIRAQGSDFVRE